MSQRRDERQSVKKRSIWRNRVRGVDAKVEAAANQKSVSVVYQEQLLSCIIDQKMHI